MFKLILYPIMLLVYVLTKLRDKLYEYKILKSTRSRLPVVSVGNIQMGGSGKTPFVISLCHKLLEENIKPVIITRGYKRSTKNQILFKNINEFSVQDVGDEPYLQKLNLPNVDIIVDHNKSRALEFAHSLSSVECIILDDGFQSKYIQKDVEIVLINNWQSENTFQLFPLGNLRESVSALKKAHHIYMTKGNNVYKKLKGYNFKQLQINYKLIDAITQKEASFQALQSKGKKKIYGVCGIANPEQFFEILNDLNIICDKKITAPNHHQYNTNTDKFEDHKNIIYITTYKDYFKLSLKNSPVFVLDMYINIDDNSLLKKIKNLI